VPSSEFATEAPRTTSSDGAVSLPVRGAPPWWIFVDVPRSGPHLLRFDARPTGPIEIRPGSRRIAGRVERLDGSAARVRLALRTVLQTEQVGYVLDARLGAVETDAQGRFVFEGVQAEPSGFHCLTGGFDIVPFESFTSKPRPLPDEGIRVVVVDASETPRLRLEVDVLDARSHGPLAEKPEVHVSQDYGAGYSFAWSVTGSRSLHRTDGLLAAGTWHVRVQADGYVTTELTTTVPRADDSPIRVLLERAR
jgi:hypothetical protein